MRKTTIAIILLIILAAIATAPPPTTHNVKGTIYAIGSGQQPNGIPVKLNQTVLIQIYNTTTNGPGANPGAYSIAINGTDGDNINVTTWNSTHFVHNTGSLRTGTTTIDVILNYTRSETNLTLINMTDNRIYNFSRTFNFTINVTMIGSSGTGCNATLTINSTAIIFTAAQNETRHLGDITLGSFLTSTWNLTANQTGSANLTVNSTCKFDTINLDGANVKSVINITVFESPGDSLPPGPHNVIGTVFTNTSNQVANGIPVKINNTISNTTAFTYTNGPGINTGAYATTINGRTGDFIIVYAYNSTYFGFNSSTLQAATTKVNVILNITRSETNVTLKLTNNSIVNTSNPFAFLANITMIGSKGVNCNATIRLNSTTLNLSGGDFTHNIGNITFGDYSIVSWTLTPLDNGTSNITVNASCESDSVNFEGLNIKSVYNITIFVKPNITLISPVNNTWLSNINNTFSFNLTNIVTLQNCSIYLNNTLNQTKTDIALNNTNFTINGTADGDYTWFVDCYSTLNERGISPTQMFSVDSTSPQVTLIAPQNNTARTDNNLNFTYSVTDHNDVTNCTLVLNDQVYLINYSVEKNKVQNFSLYLKSARYEWYINCSDNLSNIGQSELRLINISDPDLNINSSAINLSIQMPIEGQILMLNATIKNVGPENATNVTVSIYENYGEGIQLGQNSTINISAFSEITLVTNWTVKLGTFNFTWVIDPPIITNGSINESNETNNIGNKTVIVSSYTTYYGQAILDIILASQGGEFMKKWLNKTNSTGNIYAASTSTNNGITWSNLTAIGLKTDGNRSLNDWYDIDLLLNITNATDSVNRTFTTRSSPKNITSFNVFSTTIQNVSITNSTTNSNFTTGILWDLQDSTNDEFDTADQEDIVFVTAINSQKTGGYGVYDYEFKVPATLRSYRNSSLSSLQFYIELT